MVSDLSFEFTVSVMLDQFIIRERFSPCIVLAALYVHVYVHMLNPTVSGAIRSCIERMYVLYMYNTYIRLYNVSLRLVR